METVKGADSQENIQFLTRTITRRQAIKAGGIAAVGLAFSKPLIETVMPKPAFANYVVSDGGKPSIEWRPDDIASSTSPVTVELCNVSDDTEVLIENWRMRFEILQGTAVDNVLINGFPIGQAPTDLPAGTIGSLVAPPDSCADVDVDVQGAGDKLKVRVWAQGIDTNNQGTDERPVTVTIE